MKRLGFLVVLLTGWCSPALAAGVPPVITYQGTLRQAGIPVNGPHDMSFRLTDSSGSAQYGSTVNLPKVTVRQGLFSVQLDFTANQTVRFPFRL